MKKLDATKWNAAEVVHPIPMTAFERFLVLDKLSSMVHGPETGRRRDLAHVLESVPGDQFYWDWDYVHVLGLKRDDLENVHVLSLSRNDAKALRDFAKFAADQEPGHRGFKLLDLWERLDFILS